MPIGPAQSIKEFSILEKKEKRHDNISIIIIIIIIYASVPFFKVLLFDKCSVYSPLAYSFFFHQIKRFFFLFLTSIPISCCRCCHSWVNCFHVINFIDGKFVTLLVHSLLFFFLWMFAIMDMGYVGCFFFSSIRLMISTLEANTYLGMQKNQKNGVVFSLFIRDF